MGFPWAISWSNRVRVSGVFQSGHSLTELWMLGHWVLCRSRGIVVQPHTCGVSCGGTEWWEHWELCDSSLRVSWDCDGNSLLLTLCCRKYLCWWYVNGWWLRVCGMRVFSRGWPCVDIWGDCLIKTCGCVLILWDRCAWIHGATLQLLEKQKSTWASFWTCPFSHTHRRSPWKGENPTNPTAPSHPPLYLFSSTHISLTSLFSISLCCVKNCNSLKCVGFLEKHWKKINK